MSKEKRSFRDRKDAKYCNDVTGMNQILIDLKPRRSLGELYISEKYDVTEVVNYLNNQDSDITYFHLFATAIGKVMYNRPLLNRFVANRHVYEHNDLTLSFVMKISFSDKSEEVMVILPIEEDDDIYKISKKIKEKVEGVRKKGDTGTGANDAIKILGKLPNLLRIPIVGLFKFLDRHGHLPNFLIKDNIYYSSMVISNVGSLKCGSIYHNVTDFGTCSGLITIGEIKKEVIDNKERYFCDFGITIDERIADGFYFIKSLKLIEYILNNPQVLERKVSEKIDYEEK